MKKLKWIDTAAFAALLAGTAIALFVVLRGRNRLAGIAVAWAYIGILIRHFSESGLDRAYPFVTAASRCARSS